MINQKATIFCVYEILKKYTDEHHCLTAEKIIEKLKLIYDVDMERKAVARNIECLKQLDLEIETYADNHEGFCLLTRDLEPSEVRLLCDAVAASDMVSLTTQKEIIKKLLKTQSMYQGQTFNKTAYVKEDKNHSDRKIFYNIDTITMAIMQGCKIQIELRKQNYRNEMVTDRIVALSPYATLWADGKYYLVGKVEGEDAPEHFRIDKIDQIILLDREIEMLFGGFSPTQYANRCIYKNDDMKTRYEILCKEELWDDLIDYFEEDVSALKQDNQLKVNIKAQRAKMHPWIMQHLHEVEVLSPIKYREELQLIADKIYGTYWR